METVAAPSALPDPEAPGPRAALIGWLAFAVALGPMWPDFFAHLAAEPWAHPSFVFALLFALWAVLPPAAHSRERWPRAGGAVTVVAAVVVLLLVGGAMPRFARPALAIGCLGLAARYGRPAFPAAWLALWIVPVPSFVLGLGAGLERLWLRIGETLAPSGAHLDFPLADMDTGLGLCWIAAGLVLHASLRLGAGAPMRWGLALAAALLAPLVQPLGFALALCVAASGAGGGAEAVLREGPWLAVVALGVVGPEVLLWRRGRLRATGGA